MCRCVCAQCGFFSHITLVIVINPKHSLMKFIVIFIYSVPIEYLTFKLPYHNICVQHKRSSTSQSVTWISSIFKYSLDSILPNPHSGKSRNIRNFERMYNKLSQFWTEFDSILLTQLYFLLLHLHVFADAEINKCLCTIHLIWFNMVASGWSGNAHTLK